MLEHDSVQQRCINKSITYLLSRRGGNEADVTPLRPAGEKARRSGPGQLPSKDKLRTTAAPTLVSPSMYALRRVHIGSQMGHFEDKNPSRYSDLCMHASWWSRMRHM